MMTARPDTSTTADELASLVPRESVGRTVAAALAVVILLAGVWLSPAVLAPSLHSQDSNAGAASEFVEDGQLLTVTRLVPRAWPSATVTGLEPVPGARTTAMWLLPGRSELLPDVVPEDYPDALSLLRAAYPDADVEPGGNLPHRIATGDVLHLAVLWDVTDCAALDELAPLTATVRAWSGLTRNDVLWEANGPAFYIADDGGASSQLCGR